MTFLVISVIVVAFICFVLFVPIGIGAKYENGAFFIINVSFLSFCIPFNKAFKRKKKKKDNEEKPQPRKELEKGINKLDFILSLFGDFRHFVRKGVSMSDFEFDLSFGTAEACSTAVTVGALYALVYNLLGLCDKIIRITKPNVKITPFFNEAVFSLKVKGIIKTTVAHIIATAVIFAFKYSKYKSQKRRK